MTLTERIDALCHLGTIMTNFNDEALQTAITKAHQYNGWFIEDNIRLSLTSVATFFLQREILINWALDNQLSDNAHPKTIAIVMAGNIPLVGFHDWLCIFISGNYSLIKLSDKDEVLLPFLLQQLQQSFPAVATTTRFSDGVIRNFDAVIATGSNNSSHYFETYFAKYPHIIRKNRNAVAILTGEESDEELRRLATDVFQYFGLGCRNVSKLYVLMGYDFTQLLTVFHEWKEIVLIDRYKNNFDYQMALLLLNQSPFLNNGCIILKEDARIASPLATLHYEFYQDVATVKEKLAAHAHEIQCIISTNDTPFGEAQSPAIDDYADGVNTLHFVKNIATVVV
ncbi:MAG: acyl-CoA reductase [Saprospiraceae bacterium]|nr:acyl-CoA reductase [Saprospiraceae bacterium]MBP7679719.1 acyl-CoA reductase [Saprospiraceae bacterium]